MESDAVEDSVTLRKLSVGCTQEIKGCYKEIAALRAAIKETDAERETVIKEVDSLKVQNDFRDKEITMLQAHNESLEKQISTYTDVIRPQLLNELRQIKERLQQKDKQYRETIAKWEKVWEKYEVAYNKFPRVEERNAIVKKVELLRIECMKKRQESIELRKKAEQLQKIKVQRLEILKNEYYKHCAAEKQLDLLHQQLLQEIEEIKGRIALKKHQQQQKLEEESKRQEELQKQMLEKVQSESASASQETTWLKNVRISIPVFKMNFNTPFTPQEMISCSQGSTGLKSPATNSYSTSYTEGLTRKSASQPATSSQFPFVLSPSITQPIETAPTPASSTASICTPAILPNKKFIIDKNDKEPSSSNKKDSVFPEPKAVENSKSIREMYNISKSPLSSGGSKKNSILSTDNIAAKLKETIRPNTTVSENVSKIQTPTTNLSKDLNVSREDLFSEDYISCQDTLVIMETDKPVEGNIVTTVHLDSSKNEQGKSFETADLIENPSDNHSSENDNPPLEDDNCYDFNAEYGDEMFSSSLQSPPTFESVMSPAHAGFESSPSKGSDEGQEDADPPSGFSGFSFFSQPSTNIFGGQSNSEKSGNENNKSTSNFSFLF